MAVTELSRLKKTQGNGLTPEKASGGPVTSMFLQRGFVTWYAWQEGNGGVLL